MAAWTECRGALALWAACTQCDGGVRERRVPTLHSHTQLLVVGDQLEVTCPPSPGRLTRTAPHACTVLPTGTAEQCCPWHWRRAAYFAQKVGTACGCCPSFTELALWRAGPPCQLAAAAQTAKRTTRGSVSPATVIPRLFRTPTRHKYGAYPGSPPSKGNVPLTSSPAPSAFQAPASWPPWWPLACSTPPSPS